ncbi:DUF916 and DUF3324 domain-containing protein [Enterococcus sp. AZ172]|uniref:DUF916 and DUF3324 domain-containing protein n=1 Tax=unclassified Enterococcus TaxID=2608891 RepID=UPI003E160763
MNKIWKFVSLICLLFSLGTQSAAAGELGGYTIEGVPNPNQLDPTLGYFYLHEEIGASDTVKVKLINTSSEEKILFVKLTNAATNSNGLLDYTGGLPEHTSLKYSLTSLAEVSQKEVTVPPSSEVETEIKLTMPEEKLPGVIIGGIVVSEKSTENQTAEQISLENRYSYTLGLVLTNEKKVDINKHISVELESTQAKLVDGKKIVEANFLNPHPYIFADAQVQGTVINKKNQKIIKQVTNESVNIAPYSVYPFQLDWQKANLKPGVYIFKGEVSANGKNWTLEKEFTISKKQADTLNKKSVYKVTIPEWLHIASYGTIGMSILGTVYLILRKKVR